jgi:hypothetical protein
MLMDKMLRTCLSPKPVLSAEVFTGGMGMSWEQGVIDVLSKLRRGVWFQEELTDKLFTYFSALPYQGFVTFPKQGNTARRYSYVFITDYSLSHAK